MARRDTCQDEAKEITLSGNIKERILPPHSSKVFDIRVRRVIEMLQQSPRHGLRDLAASVHLSASRLSRLFKDETGLGLGEYIFELRMRRAASLLAATEEPVKCIASAVGYHHSSSFVRAFNTRFAESPLAYRVRMQLFLYRKYK